MRKKQMLWFLLTILLVFTVTGVSFAELQVSPDANALQNEVKSAADRIATWVRGVFGFVVAALFIFGGIKQVFAHGDAQKIAAAKQLYTYGVASLIIVFMADKIVSLIMGILGTG